MNQPGMTESLSIDEQASNWLARLSAEDISHEEQAAFSQWLATSPQHQAAYEEAVILWQDLGDACDQYYQQSDISFEEELAAVRETRSPVPTRRPMMVALAGGFMMLLVMLLNPIWLSSSTADYRTGNGEISQFTLPDGSLITLNSNTALDISFTQEQRQIRLYQGEALFDVASNPARPFTVNSSHGATQVLGTVFNVATDHQSTRVDVLEGTVQVSAQGGQQRTLNAQMYQRFDDQFLNDPQSAAAAQQRIKGWQQGLLIVRNEPLANVIEQLNNHYSGYILLQGDALAERKMSGVFSLKDRESAIELLRQQLGLQRQDLPRLTLLSRR